jgi:hypothetical protein
MPTGPVFVKEARVATERPAVALAPQVNRWGHGLNFEQRCVPVAAMVLRKAAC